MERTEVSGVPVFVAQGPQPLSAGLVVGVGRRDEDFTTGGVTHLLEHLVMHAVGRLPLDCNASVSLNTLEFTATGRPERVAGFLRRVCELLTDPPLDRLTVEAGVLQAEGLLAGPPGLTFALGRRYGAQGVGLAAYGQPALLEIRAEQVKAWAARWATRDNAALWLTGPVPAGLDLPLPAGAVVRGQDLQPARHALPAWTEHPAEDVALTLELPYRSSGHVGMRLLAERVEDDLRHGRGMAYDVQLHSERLDEHRVFAGVWAEVRAHQAGVAARALLAAFDDLATLGPGDAELKRDLESAEEYWSDPRAGEDEVQAAAEAHVRGWSTRTGAELLGEARELTAVEVRDVMAEARATLLLGVPEEADCGPAGIERLPEWSPDVVAGTPYKRRWRSEAPRGAQLVVGDAGVSVVLAPGEQSTVRWADVVGLVQEEDDTYVLVGADGCTVPIAAADWRNGDDALAFVQARVPRHLQVRADPVPAE